MASVELKLKPWTTPNFAQIEQPPGKRQDGFKELPSISVKDLSPQALSDLAEQWCNELYRRAGKAQNFRFEKLP